MVVIVRSELDSNKNCPLDVEAGARDIPVVAVTLELLGSGYVADAGISEVSTILERKHNSSEGKHRGIRGVAYVWENLDAAYGWLPVAFACAGRRFVQS